MVGSTSFPFSKVVIKEVINKTYEPGLEEAMHNALSREFILHGIGVTSKETGEGIPQLETVIKVFAVNTIAVSDNKVVEQALLIQVDFRFIDNKRITEFRSISSPINVTFQTTGDISQAVVEKQKAIERLSTEVAKELVSRLAMRYAK